MLSSLLYSAKPILDCAPLSSRQDLVCIRNAHAAVLLSINLWVYPYISRMPPIAVFLHTHISLVLCFAILKHMCWTLTLHVSC